MTDHCRTVAADRGAVCVPGACSCSPNVKVSKSVFLSSAKVEVKEEGTWKKIRSGVMFTIACIASPCCTPLIVPIAIALLAGTPLAIWLAAHTGLVYGGSTLLSIVSLVLGLRWWNNTSVILRERSDRRILPQSGGDPSLRSK
jgi:hypothetical protein